MKTTIRIILGLAGLPVMIFAAFLVYATLSDYQPEPEVTIYENHSASGISDRDEFSLMIWNIGYAGLSKDMDFFYDGGRQVRPKEQVVKGNIKAIKTYLASLPGIDFFLLQEVDKKSRRSYHINEYERLAASHPGFKTFFGKNYDVSFVPLPPSNPLGRIESGLQTLSRFEPFSVVRYAFPGNYSWPRGVFMLDRCFLVSRYKVKGGRTLVVINTHNSAYDDGTLRKQQMDYLQKILDQEYQKGSYVIVGGDWNQCPPQFVPAFKNNLMDNQNRMDIDIAFMPGWQWAYDKTVPTNRRLSAPYDEASSLTTVIDFFLVSPNIEIRSVKGIYLNFEHSDHQPVMLQIRLKQE